jgi:hypothetical protein
MNERGTAMDSTAAPARKQDRATIALLIIAAMVATGGIGFALGHITAQSGTSGAGAGAQPFASGRGFPGAGRSLAPGETFNPGQFGGGQPRIGTSGGVSGTVQSVSGSAITILMSDGQSVTIDLTGNTTWHGETSASASQVAIGSTVTISLDTTALASSSPNPGASGGRTLTAKDVLITTP